MSFAVLCPGCRHQVAVQESMAGQPARCPHCATAFQVPARPKPLTPPSPRPTFVPPRPSVPPRKTAAEAVNPPPQSEGAARKPGSLRRQTRAVADSSEYPEPPPRTRTMFLGLMSAGIVLALLLISLAVVAFRSRDERTDAPRPPQTERRIAEASSQKPHQPTPEQPPKADPPDRVKLPQDDPPPKPKISPPEEEPSTPPPSRREEAPLPPGPQEPLAKPSSPPSAETKTDPSPKSNDIPKEPAAKTEAAKPDTPPAKSETAKPDTPPKNEVSKTDASTNFPAGRRRLSGDQIYRRLVKSTVFVHNSEGWGSGSLIHGPRKLILTNYHVVGEEREVAVCFPRYDASGKLIVDGDLYERAYKKGEFIRGKVLKVAKGQDLALVQLDSVPEGTPVLKLAARSASPGETVHSVGNPGASDARWSYTSGTVRQVSHKNWRAKVERSVLKFDADVVETQSPTNPGDSGGPLVNDALQLVAVTQGANVAARELSLFIDLSEVKKLLQSCSVALEDVVGPADALAEGEVEAGDLLALMKLLEDKEAKNRVEAARRLGTLGPAARPATRALTKALKDDEPWVRRNAALALSKIGPQADDRTRKHVFDAVSDADADVRLAALEALANLGPPTREELPTLLSLLHESVRRQQTKASVLVVRSLIRLGPEAKEAVPDLRQMLKSDEREVRLQALRLLRKIGPESRKAASDVVVYLKDTDRTLRLQAAFVLVAGDPGIVSEGKEGLSVLILALRPESMAEMNDSQVQERIKEISAVLLKLGGPAAEGLRRTIGSEFRGGRSGSDEAKLNAAARESVLKIITDMGGEAHSPQMITTLIELQRGDPSRAVRAAAKQAYIKIQNQH